MKEKVRTRKLLPRNFECVPSACCQDPSQVALPEVSTFFLPYFLLFFLTLVEVKNRGYHTLLKPYETNCDL